MRQSSPINQFMDGDDERHSVGAGEFNESAISDHPRLAALAEPWTPFDWQQVFEHLDGAEAAPERPRERLAGRLFGVLVWLVSDHRGKPNLLAIGCRAAMLAMSLNLPVSEAAKTKLRKARFRERQKAKKQGTR